MSTSDRLGKPDDILPDQMGSIASKHGERLERMAEFARKKGWPSFWKGLSEEIDHPLDEIGPEVGGFITAWLSTRPRRPKELRKQSKYHDRLKGALAEIAAIKEDFENDPIYSIPTFKLAPIALVEQLLAHADHLELLARAEASRNSSTMESDVQLVGALADVFRASGGVPASTPNGKFGRFLKATWEVLPQGQRPSSPETLLHYAKPALKKRVSEHQALRQLESDAAEVRGTAVSSPSGVA